MSVEKRHERPRKGRPTPPAAFYDAYSKSIICTWKRFHKTSKHRPRHANCRWLWWVLGMWRATHEHVDKPSCLHHGRGHNSPQSHRCILTIAVISITLMRSAGTLGRTVAERTVRTAAEKEPMLHVIVNNGDGALQAIARIL